MKLNTREIIRNKKTLDQIECQKKVETCGDQPVNRELFYLCSAADRKRDENMIAVGQMMLKKARKPYKQRTRIHS